jgi:N-acyl-phosphatidylethanolamine-hydrolysing phospholipase D
MGGDDSGAGLLPQGRRERLSPRVALPFFWRRLCASFRPRPGAAPAVAFDPKALARNPAVTWIGHASFFVRMDTAAFVVDPMYAERASPLSFAGPRRLVPPGVPLDSLPSVDFVLLTHDHYDHTDLPTLRRLAAADAAFVVPLGHGDLVRSVGGRVVAELGWWQDVEVGGLRVTCTPARHFSGRGFRDGQSRLWAGFVVAGPTRRFYHAGDTGLFEGFEEIGRRLGPIDLAAVPIGAYEPQAIMAPVHLDPEQAVRAGLELSARQIVGMHFGTFDLSDEPLDEPPRRFLAEAERRGLAERAFVMSIGETRDF